MLRLSMPALLLALAGCATKPPANPDNLCEIFREKPKWHEAALKMQQRWGAPVQVPMAMMYQESSFKHDALPPRYYFLGFIPWGRVSSAYGYAQAKDETWADYKREAGGWGASRDDFADALDFMGWYIQKSQRVNGVSKWDAYGQYLNYHEGWGGYRNRSYDAKPWLKNVSQKVQSRASLFGAQYLASRSCRAAAGSGRAVRARRGPEPIPPSTRATDNVRQAPQVGPARSNGQPASWNRRRILPSQPSVPVNRRVVEPAASHLVERPALTFRPASLPRPERSRIGGVRFPRLLFG